jgi:hypothetical protein
MHSVSDRERAPEARPSWKEVLQAPALFAVVTGAVMLPYGFRYALIHALGTGLFFGWLMSGGIPVLRAEPDVLRVRTGILLRHTRRIPYARIDWVDVSPAGRGNRWLVQPNLRMGRRKHYYYVADGDRFADALRARGVFVRQTKRGEQDCGRGIPPELLGRAG